MRKKNKLVWIYILKKFHKITKKNPHDVNKQVLWWFFMLKIGKRISCLFIHLFELRAYVRRGTSKCSNLLQ